MNSTCTLSQENLDLFVSGDLNKKELESIRLHLLDCEGCRRAYQESRASLESLAVLRSEEIPEEVWQGFWESIHSQTLALGPPPRRSTPWILLRQGWPLLVCAAAALLFFHFMPSLRVEHNRPGSSDKQAQDVTVEDAAGIDSPAIDANLDFSHNDKLKKVLEYLEEKDRKEKELYELDEMDNNPNIRLTDF